MATPRPRVHIVATGGSISGLGPHRLDYILYPELGQRLRIEEMLARIPEAQEVAHVERIGNLNGLLAAPRRPPPGRGRVTRRAAPASAACSPAARGGTRSGQAPPLLGGADF